MPFDPLCRSASMAVPPSERNSTAPCNQAAFASDISSDRPPPGPLRPPHTPPTAFAQAQPPEPPPPPLSHCYDVATRPPPLRSQCESLSTLPDDLSVPRTQYFHPV